MDLALNNLQWLIYHQTKQNQPNLITSHNFETECHQQKKNVKKFLNFFLFHFKNKEIKYNSEDTTSHIEMP